MVVLVGVVYLVYVVWDPVGVGFYVDDFEFGVLFENVVQNESFYDVLVTVYDCEEGVHFRILGFFVLGCEDVEGKW